MIALATWHDALPHVHASGQTVVLDSDHEPHDDHDTSDQRDLSDLIHVAAHAVVQAIDVPSPPVVAVGMISSAMRWGVDPAEGLGSLRSKSLLRPPRF
jgi:hypothetical protein